MIDIEQTDIFRTWLGQLRDGRGRGKIVARIRRMELGNPGKVGPVGGGISEMKIDVGPG